MYISLNGNLIAAEENIFGVVNRSFNYGDGLFETIRWQNNRPLFFESHLERLFAGMKYLSMKIPLTWNGDYFLNEIKTLLQLNQIDDSVRIRLQVYRNEGGYYAPHKNEVGFVLTTNALENTNYIFNEVGFRLNIFESEFKTLTPLSNFKTSSALVYVLGGLYAKENKLDDCLILNSAGNICDSVNANVFIVKNKRLITPPVSEGCIDGVMRKEIIRTALMNKISCNMRPLTIEDCLGADEIFLTNVIKGIQWVGELEGMEYGYEISKSLFDIVSDRIK